MASTFPTSQRQQASCTFQRQEDQHQLHEHQMVQGQCRFRVIGCWTGLWKDGHVIEGWCDPIIINNLSKMGQHGANLCLASSHFGHGSQYCSKCITNRYFPGINPEQYLSTSEGQRQLCLKRLKFDILWISQVYMHTYMQTCIHTYMQYMHQMHYITFIAGITCITCIECITFILCITCITSHYIH